MPALRAWLPSTVLPAGCVLLVGALCLWRADRASADDGAKPAVTSPGAVEGILLMRNGLVVSGRIIKAGSDYEVHSAYGGKAVYPGASVKMHCASLTEAYGKLRETAKAQRDADAHILLARWCLTNHLDGEACDELRDALTMEPERDDARRLLRNAEETIQAKNRPAVPVIHDDPVRAARLAAAAADEAVSLGGLSREQAMQFSRRIQPLLVNNCTAAGCHGRESETRFRLYKVTPGKDSNRHASERNLAEVLDHIDLDKPRASPVLTAPRGNHGRRGRPIFAGQRGEEQLAELRKWVVAVAKDESVRERFGEHDARRKIVEAQASVSGDEGGEAVSARDTAGDRVPPMKDPFGATGKSSKKPQTPVPPLKSDPFDPAVFNRGTSRPGAGR